MSTKWPKFICDPVHKLIRFDNTECDRLLLELIGTKEFQRLRRIKQLGMTELVFPGANHSRFAHSIGVMHLARVFLDRLDVVCSLDKRPTAEQRLVVLVAALIHDIGHGPFSHAFEKVTGLNHEKWTETIILNSSTEINQCLVKYDKFLPGKLIRFFDSEGNEDGHNDDEIPAYLTQIVSSQLDADRFDYLLRDSHSAGTTTGHFEHEYIIHNLFLDEDNMRLYIGRKSLLAAEAYVLARYRMYQTMYFHKTTRSAEVMLQLLFKRYKQLITEKQPSIIEIVQGAPRYLMEAFKGEISLEQYVALDDTTITEFFKCAIFSEDPMMSSISKGLLNRLLYKVTDKSGTDYEVNRRYKRDTQNRMIQNGYDPEFEFVEDTASDTPYKVYDPGAQRTAKVIYVEKRNHDIEEISNVSAPVKAVIHNTSLLRYYYPTYLADMMQ